MQYKIKTKEYLVLKKIIASVKPPKHFPFCSVNVKWVHIFQNIKFIFLLGFALIITKKLTTNKKFQNKYVNT